jgi:hypothetical protein
MVASTRVAERLLEHPARADGAGSYRYAHVRLVLTADAPEELVQVVHDAKRTAHGVPSRPRRSVGILSYPRRMGNTWGQLFRVTTWGESHGGATGAVRRLPARLPLSEADIQPDLDRRAPGQSALVSQRKESDTVQILSGVFEGQTLGTPISLLIPNEDMRPGDYREVREKYRPSHADYTYDAKYGIRDWRGGGRTSARETAGRVAAAAIARKLLAVRFNVTVVARSRSGGSSRSVITKK